MRYYRDAPGSAHRSVLRRHPRTATACALRNSVARRSDCVAKIQYRITHEKIKFTTQRPKSGPACRRAKSLFISLALSLSLSLSLDVNKHTRPALEASHAAAARRQLSSASASAAATCPQPQELRYVSSTSDWDDRWFQRTRARVTWLSQNTLHRPRPNTSLNHSQTPNVESEIRYTVGGRWRRPPSPRARRVRLPPTTLFCFVSSSRFGRRRVF